MSSLLLRRHRQCLHQAAVAIPPVSKFNKRLISNASPRVKAGIRPIKALLEEHRKVIDTSKGEKDGIEPLRLAGYVRSIRSHRKVTFVDLTDGSLPGDNTLQVVLRQTLSTHLSIGASVEITGHLQASKGAEQPVEFAAQDLTITGACDSAAYPLAASTSQTTPALLRKYAHLRSRNARHASVLRCRNLIEKTISDYFWENQYIRVAAPIITSSDCEGGGEVFTVHAGESSEAGARGTSQLDADLAEEPSLSGSTPDPASNEVGDTSELRLEPSIGGSVSDAANTIEKNRSFWADTTAYLTVSSQLHLESMTYGLGRVYTIGPSFRAESSATNRHLAEFWMCEAEMMTTMDVNLALESIIATVVGLTKRVIESVASHAEASFLWLDDILGLEELSSFSQQHWPRMSYTEAIALLQDQKVAFSIQPQWGDSLASEHERWLARKGPIFITDYPSTIKPFYMKANEKDAQGRKTVACFDLLVPKLGELVGGSLRENNLEVLHANVAEMESAMPNHLQWYINDLRKFGSGPHGGFGLGMERLLSWVTKTDNLRDCLTFPRVKGPLRY